MRKFLLLIVLALFAAMLAAALAACSTGDSRTDAAAAQSFLPTVPGFNTVDADSIADGLAAAGAAANASFGNFLGSAAVLKVNDVIQCYQDVGAASALLYVPQTLVGGTQFPEVGAVAVINETRIQRNLLQCVLGTADRGAATAQAAAFEPCNMSGRFTASNEQFNFVYIGTGPALCSAYQAHFTGLGATFNDPQG